ncbi:hypothetical protein F5148DRAFT_479661 [Russula earlei]|uniref:Uncharacterized protein n=1 Tax=Russula earlei TaxID=71964 RepID=A0ACC0TY69_9AGAM|nr:hypothetical protein F5148DRAFT_479661 [Russula earlei]
MCMHMLAPVGTASLQTLTHESTTSYQLFVACMFTIGHPYSFPSDSRSSIPVGGTSASLETDDVSTSPEEGFEEQQRQDRVTIDMLPHDVLLDIFDFCQMEPTLPYNVYFSWEWLYLVHVCRRWRQVIFTSPQRLSLQLVCTPRTPARETLGIWPPLPIIVEQMSRRYPESDAYEDNLVAALELHDRVRVILVSDLTSSLFEKFVAAMVEPFPALTTLSLALGSAGVASPLPEAFLGGSAPRLQRLDLQGIPFPTLPKLALSPNHLTALCLRDVPPAGYISSDTMAACLSTLTGLGELVIQFNSPRPRPDPSSQRLLPSTRAVLPALVYFSFKGVSEYLEDLIARIDAPTLEHLEAVFFHQLIFDVQRLSQFSQRTPRLKSPNRVRLILLPHSVQVEFSHYPITNLYFRISCSQSDWQLSSIAQVCGSPFPLSQSAERIDITEDGTIFPPKWLDDAHYSQWLEFLQPFSAVRQLQVSEMQRPLLMRALQDLTGGRTMDVLPQLSDIFFGGPPLSESLRETIQPFLAARRLSDRPVAVHCREAQNWTVMNL